MDPEMESRSLAACLVPALLVRTITNWNATWGRPIEEFNADVHVQAQSLRQKLLDWARVLAGIRR
jgi:hypothetical protein